MEAHESEHDAEHCGTRRFADQAVAKLEELLEEGFVRVDGVEQKPTTEMLAHAWQHIVEASLLRLTRLRPEMVRRVHVSESGEEWDDEED